MILKFRKKKIAKQQQKIEKREQTHTHTHVTLPQHFTIKMNLFNNITFNPIFISIWSFYIMMALVSQTIYSNLVEKRDENKKKQQNRIKREFIDFDKRESEREKNFDA